MSSFFSHTRFFCHVCSISGRVFVQREQPLVMLFRHSSPMLFGKRRPRPFSVPTFAKIPRKTAKKGCRKGTPLGFTPTLPQGKIEA
jgi:hypothetical protein